MWQKKDNLALGQPVTIGNYAVLYTSTHHVPYLDIVDPKSGKSLWRMASGGWWRSSPADFQPAVLGTKVAFTDTDQLHGDSTRVLIVDVTTRKVTYGPRIDGSLSRVWSCGTTFCVGADVGESKRVGTVDPNTAKITVSAALGVGIVRSLDNSGLVSVRQDGKPDQIALFRDNRLVWKKSVATTFGANRSFRYGSDATYLPSKSLFIASVRSPFTAGLLGSTYQAVAINARTGNRLWARAGSVNNCYETTGVSVLYRAGLLCSFSKDTTYVDGKFTAGTATLDYVDVSTGKVRTSIGLGSLVGRSFVDLGRMVNTVDTNTVLVHAGNGVLLDLRTGSKKSTEGNQTMLCRKHIDISVWGNTTETVGEVPDDTTGYSVSVCDKQRQDVTQRSVLPGAVGATVGSVQMFTTNQTLIGGTVTGAAVKTATVPADAGTTAATPRITAATAVRWTASGFLPASQPVVSGDRALVYGTVKGVFSVVAVNTSNGKIVWSRAASLSGVFGGVHRPAVIGKRVLFMEPVPAYESVRPAIADVATGRILARSISQVALKSTLDICGDLVCTVLGSNKGGSISVRFDLLSASLAQDAGDGGYTSMQPVVPGVYKTKKGTVQKLIGTEQGWNRFDVAAASVTPAGRVLSSTEAPTVDGVIVRGFGIAIQSSGKYAPIHRGREIGLVGISAISGKRAWALKGGDRDCLDFTVADAGIPVVCTWGANAVSQYTPQGATHSALSVELRGVDPQTGKLSSWKVKLANGAGVQTTGTFGMADQSHVLVPTTKGSISVEVTTGKSTVAQPSTPRLCSKVLEARTGSVAFDGNGTEQDDWSVGESWSWCDESDNYVAAAKSWPSWVGAQAGSDVIVLTEKGLQASPRS